MLRVLAPWLVLIFIVSFCLIGAWWIEVSPITNDGFIRGQPKKAGVYRTRLVSDPTNYECFNYWNGSHWLSTASTAEEALQYTQPSCHQSYWFKEV